MKTNADLILVADGGHARLISHSTDEDAILWEMEWQEAAKPSRALGSDKPGRTFESTTHRSATMEQRTAPHRAAQLAFAREVADKVEESLLALRFNRFVVVAPPRTVGDLRREFCEQVLDAITSEVQKDLVALSDHEVIARISGGDLRLQ